MEPDAGSIESSDKKPCRYCGSPMSSTASVCPTCKSHQSPWRATALFAASIAGLLGVLGSAGAYIFTALPAAYRTVAWKDQIRVWDFEAGLFPTFGTTISNNGDGPVLLAKLLVRFGTGGSAEYYVGKTLAPGDSFTQVRPSPPIDDYGGHIESASGEVSEGIWNAAQLGDVGSNTRNPCYLIVFYHRDSTAIARMTEHASTAKRKLVTRNDAEANAIFNSLHYGRTVSVPFPVTMTFLENRKAHCEYAREIVHWDEVLRSKPGDADALNNRCYAKASDGRLNGALLDCGESLRLRPDSADTLDSRAFTYLKMGRSREAAADFDSALAIKPLLASSLFGRGVARRRLDELAAGDADIADAMKIKPDIGEDYAARGVTK